MAEANGKPIVVAVDGSAPGWEAMDTALYLASLLKRPVDVMTVLQHRKSGYFAFIDRHLEEEQQDYARKILVEAAQRGQQAGVEVRQRQGRIHGLPARGGAVHRHYDRFAVCFGH